MPSGQASYRAIFDTAVDAIVVIDEGGGIQAANRAVQSIFGYAAHELVGRNVAMLMPPRYADAHDGFLHAYRDTGQRKIIGIGREVEGQRKNGEIFPLELSIAEWRDGAGERFFTGILRDISERHRAAAALRESQEWLTTVTDTALVGLVVIDKQHRIRFANRAYAVILGLPSYDLVGVHIADVVPTVYEAIVKPRIDSALTEGRGSYEASYPPDGPAELRRNLIVTYEPRRNPAGEQVVVVVIVDVSELKRTEAALRANRDLLQSVLDATADSIFAKDPDGRYVMVNETAAALAGIDREAIIGNTDAQMWPGSRALLNVNHDREVMARSRPIAVERSADIDGETRQFVVTKSPWFGEDGRILGVVGISRDITEQKRSTAERDDLIRRLMAAEEEERLRIARELHDQLGQDVTGLSLGLKELEGMLDGPAALERVAWLRSLTDRIGRELQRTAIELRPTSLEDLGLSEAISSHVSLWSARFGIKCDVHVDDLEGLCLPDDASLTIYRCVQEALTNILKYASAHYVSVVARRHSEDLRVIVEDDGIGFDIGAVTASKGGRRGLGLAGMRERLGLIGGRLNIESSPGAGSTLFLTVPLQGRPRLRT